MVWNGEVDCPNDNPKKYNTIQLIINQQKFGGIAYNSINLRVVCKVSDNIIINVKYVFLNIILSGFSYFKVVKMRD